jgi:hypothetical protein
MFVSMPSDGSSAPVRFEYGGGKYFRKSLGVSTICPSASIIFMTILLEFVASVDEPKLIRRIKKCQTAEFAGGLFVEQRMG